MFFKILMVYNGRRYVSVGVNGHQPVMAGFLPSFILRSRFMYKVKLSFKITIASMRYA
jgi:hypothetical protein